jgi:hypothetical protein
MRISALSEILNSELKKAEGVKKTEITPQSRTVPIDQTDFSIKGKRLNDTKAQIEVITSKLASEPDIRPEKIAEAKEKIKNGFYDSEDFLEKLTNKLLNEFNIK